MRTVTQICPIYVWIDFAKQQELPDSSLKLMIIISTRLALPV